MKILLAGAVAFALAVAPALAADEVPKPAIHPLLDEAYSGDASKHAVVSMVDWAVGADTGWHTHPGDEYATVLQGEIGIITKGQGKQSYRVYKAGEAYHNLPGVVHGARNVGSGPAKSVVVIIAAKGAPLTQPAQ